MTLCDECKGVYEDVFLEYVQPLSAMTRSVAMKQEDARDTSNVPVAVK